LTASPEVSTAIHGILDDWRSRHQHWSLMEVFLPSTQRHQSPALFSWYEAIESATFEIRDDAVAVAKLRWWRDELALAVEGKSQASADPSLVSRHRLVSGILAQCCRCGPAFTRHRATACQRE
jgi:phytoene/squalene synthetase